MCNNDSVMRSMKNNQFFRGQIVLGTNRPGKNRPVDETSGDELSGDEPSGDEPSGYHITKAFHWNITNYKAFQWDIGYLHSLMEP